MKIAILTYHRSQNYGALLQAVALREALREMGNDVYFIDYWPNYHKNLYKNLDWGLLRLPYGKESLYIFARSLILYRKRKKRSEAFNQFISKYILKTITPYDKSEKFDVIVYGSDQIWRKQKGLNWKFNPVYFGENILSAKRSISYAASMGIVHSSSQDKDFIRERISKFDTVLVRENSLRLLLQDCGIKSEVVLDPTLLLDAHKWEEMFGLKQDESSDYLLFYNLQFGSIDYHAVKEYAKRRNLKIKVISGEPIINKDRDIEFVENADPERFLRLIHGAKVIVTSSYHGLIFSLIFNKEFFAVFQENKDRANSLLNELSLHERMLPPHTANIPDLSPIDYNIVNDILDKARKESLGMLSSAIN